MKVSFTSQAWADYLHWQASDRQVLKRVNRLIAECRRDPQGGIGKPEPLKHLLQGAWSRRIDEEHRLVYLVDEGEVIILQCRYHY